MTARTWSGACNLLAVRLDSLGDVLMTTPALRAIKQTEPDRRVTLLTPPAGAEVAALVPEVDAVLAYEAPWMKATTPRASSAAEYTLIERLREQRFDGAVIFTVYSQNPLPAALLCYLADIPLRLAHCHENPYQLLTDWLPDPEPALGIRHEVRRQLDLVGSIGCRAADERLALRVPAAARAHVARRLSALGLDSEQDWVLIHPGATAPSRRYPPEQFAAVARRLVLEHGYQVLFCGGAAEGALVAEIQAALQAPSLALVNCLSLAELAALIAQAPLLVANNSGPAHLAAAVGTPVVTLYALTNPQHTPWGVPNRVLSHDVPCKFCYRSVCPEGHGNCLCLVEPDAVVEAVLDLVETRANGDQSRLARSPDVHVRH